MLTLNVKQFIKTSYEFCQKRLSINRLAADYAHWHQARECPSARIMPIGVEK